MAGKRKGAAPLSGRQADCCAPTSGTRQNFAGARSPPPRKASNNLFHLIRGLGNLQTTCFIQSEASESFKQLVSSNPRPRKPSNNLFHPIRGLGNLQTTCFIQSEASGRPPPPPLHVPSQTSQALRDPSQCVKRPCNPCAVSPQCVKRPCNPCTVSSQCAPPSPAA